MKSSRQVILGLILLLVGGLLLRVPAFADTNHPPVKQTPAIKPWHVTEMQMEGFPRCGAGTWMFDFSWKPILQAGTPWAKYKVAGYKCTQSKYSCTADRCYAEIWGCSTRLSGTWAGVTADLGTSVSGMRVGTFLKPPSCK